MATREDRAGTPAVRLRGTTRGPPIVAAWVPMLAVAVLFGCGSLPPTANTDFPTDPLLVGVVSRSGQLRFDVWTAPAQPPAHGTISVKLSVTDVTGGAGVDGLLLDIVPEMPSMGHGTPTVPQVSAEGGGTYVATDVDLYMAGRWDLSTTITDGSDSGRAPDSVTLSLDVR